MDLRKGELGMLSDFRPVPPDNLRSWNPDGEVAVKVVFLVAYIW
jgi:hypothetical protein